MVRRKSHQAAETDTQVEKALLGIRSGLYKSAYDAAKQLGISKATVTRRAAGCPTRTQARQSQQNLSPAQESALLKWIKQLTIGGYSPTHLLLREIAEEVRSNRSRNLDDACDASPSGTLEIRPPLPLGREWVLRFIKRHPHLQVVLGRRIDSVRMDGATKPVVSAWFDAYELTLLTEGIEPQNTYNMDESGFSIGTMESTRIVVDSTLHTKHQAHSGRQGMDFDARVYMR